MAGYGTATQGWMIYLIVLLGAWGGIAGPAAQALITKHVPPDEQGALQGSLSGLASLAYVFGPIIAAWSFGKGIAHPERPVRRRASPSTRRRRSCCARSALRFARSSSTTASRAKA